MVRKNEFALRDPVVQKPINANLLDKKERND
jgi:hypothetical protein